MKCLPTKSQYRYVVWLHSTLFTMTVFMVSQLAIVGYLHRDNNYGLHSADYSIRTIGDAEFSKLTAEQQALCVAIPNDGTHMRITIRNPFVFWHVKTALFPSLILAVVALLLSFRISVQTLPQPDQSIDASRIVVPNGIA
ncbi:MAG: hypothetical protein JWN70_927 [Planctomycetaceae bacterium]|nr:hypothetical protein [Planctomycetaceae bacterium]